MSRIMVSGMIVETDDMLPKTYTWNSNNKMATAAFTLMGNTYTQTYTYDTSGNLTGVSAWVKS